MKTIQNEMIEDMMIKELNKSTSNDNILTDDDKSKIAAKLEFEQKVRRYLINPSPDNNALTYADRLEVKKALGHEIKPEDDGFKELPWAMMGWMAFALLIGIVVMAN